MTSTTARATPPRPPGGGSRRPAPSLLLLLAILSLSLPRPAHPFSSAANPSKRVFVSTPVPTGSKRTVADCMEPATVRLTPGMSVDEAIATLLAAGLEAAVVVDGNRDGDGTDTVVGIVTSFDFLQREAFGGSLLPMEGSAETVASYVGAAKMICGQRVSDVMTRNPRTVGPDASMREAAAIMARERLHRLPVVVGGGDGEGGGEGGRLVGMLTSSDVMRDVLKVVRELPESAAREEDGNGNSNGDSGEGGEVAP